MGPLCPRIVLHVGRNSSRRKRMNLHFLMAASVGNKATEGFAAARPARVLCEKTTSRLLARRPARLTWLPVCSWELPPPNGPEPVAQGGGAGPAAPSPRCTARMDG